MILHHELHRELCARVQGDNTSDASRDREDPWLAEPILTRAEENKTEHGLEEVYTFESLRPP